MADRRVKRINTRKLRKGSKTSNLLTSLLFNFLNRLRNIRCCRTLARRHKDRHGLIWLEMQVDRFRQKRLGIKVDHIRLEAWYSLSHRRLSDWIRHWVEAKDILLGLVIFCQVIIAMLSSSKAEIVKIKLTIWVFLGCRIVNRQRDHTLHRIWSSISGIHLQKAMRCLSSC